MEKWIILLVVCGIGADLCTMPLVVCIIALRTGMFPGLEPPGSINWITEWWVLAAAVAALACEITLDTLLDRRETAGKQVWVKTQHLISACVCLIVVLAFSEGFTSTQIVSCVGASWIATGIIREGLVEKFKHALEWFGDL